MLRYLIITAISITLMIYFKNVVLQTILFLMLPISDFRSTLIEINILIIGILTCFLFFILGYFAHRYFIVSRRSFIIYVHLLFSPILLSKWFNTFEWLNNWSQLLLNLLAEPYRILTFTVQFSEIFGLLLPILLIGMGTLTYLLEKKRPRITLQIQKAEG